MKGVVYNRVAANVLAQVLGLPDEAVRNCIGNFHVAACSHADGWKRYVACT